MLNVAGLNRGFDMVPTFWTRWINSLLRKLWRKQVSDVKFTLTPAPANEWMLFLFLGLNSVYIYICTSRSDLSWAFFYHLNLCNCTREWFRCVIDPNLGPWCYPASLGTYTIQICNTETSFRWDICAGENMHGYYWNEILGLIQRTAPHCSWLGEL